MSISEHGIYFLTGSLRSGKGLTAVSKIQEHLLDGRRVATNMDLKLEGLVSPLNKTTDVIRLPDKPNVHDLENIGLGYDHEDPEHYDESKFGLLVLDELATFLNSRTWNQKGRKEFVDWLLMSGKKRWILIFTIQDLELLDKQVKASLASQYIVHCKSMSKYAVPIISPFCKLLTGKPLTLPKFYLAIVKIGMDRNAPVNDRWVTKGTALYSGYNTAQVYLERDHPDSIQLCTMLPPWYTHGRYIIKKDLEYYRKLFTNKIEYLVVPCLVGVFLSFLAFSISLFTSFTSKVDQIETMQNQMSLMRTIINEKLPSQLSSQPDISHVSCDRFEENKYQGFYIKGSYSTPNGMEYFLTNGIDSIKTKTMRKSGMGLISKGQCSFALFKGECSISFDCEPPFTSNGSHAVGVVASERVGEAVPVESDSKPSMLPGLF